MMSSKYLVRRCLTSRLIPLLAKSFLMRALIVSLLSLANMAAMAKGLPILVLGDSLSASYGIPVEKGWVALLKQHIEQHPFQNSYAIINASISGETTGGALRRFPSLLKQHNPYLVIIELGGNDGLRGFPITTLRNNLDELVTLAKSANAKVLIAGMRIPPNYGPRYTRQFFQSFQDIAQQHQVPLVPFLLDEVAIYPELMQADGIHPTADAQPKILNNVLPTLEDMLK